MKKVLLIELAGIGDVVLSSTVLRNIKQCHPEISVYFLTFEAAAQMLDKCPYQDRLFIFQKGLKGIVNNIKVLNELRKEKIDIAINLYQHYTLKGSLLMFCLLKMIKAKSTLGRNTDGKGGFYDIKIPDSINTPRHDVEYKLELLKELNCVVKVKELEVWIDDSDREKIEKFLNKNGVSDSDFLVGINPGAHRLSHRWDWRKFAEAADFLAKDYQAKIVITGSKDERWLADKIFRKMSSQAIISSGELSLLQLAALIKRCNLYITNDTGPMHIANALKVPLIVVEGPSVEKTLPYYREKCIIVKKDFDCSPCYKFRCKDNKCLKSILPEDVLKAAEKLLNKNA